MIVIELIDGTKINLSHDTVLTGFTNANVESTEEFHLHYVYAGSLKDSRLKTTDPKYGLCGFLGTVDWFTINFHTAMKDVFYQSSAIKAIYDL